MIKKVKCIDNSLHENRLTVGKIYDVQPGSVSSLAHDHCYIKDDTGENNYWRKYRFVEVSDKPLQISVCTSQISYAVEFLVNNASWWNGNSRDQVEQTIHNEVRRAYDSMESQVEKDNPFLYNIQPGGYIVLGMWDDFDERIGQIQVFVDAGLNKTGYVIDVNEVLNQDE